MDTGATVEPVWSTTPIMETDTKEKRPAQTGGVIPKPYLKYVPFLQSVSLIAAF